MHDREVRRRRAVLAVLVVVSVVLLTAYFSEPSSGPLHGVQRDVVAVLSPVQDGVSTVLSPVRDVSDWISGTLRAKSQRDHLQKQVQSLRTQLATAQQKGIAYGQLTRQVGLDQRIGASGFHPVWANVIDRNPSLWYQQVEVDKGSRDGVALNDPVIGEGALVGKVTTVVSGSSYVTLISDHTVGVAAEVQDAGGDTGVLQPAVGNPGQLLLQQLPNSAPITQGQLVVTAGFRDPSQPTHQGSLYPPGIPIGTVSSFSQNELLNNGQVTVSPAADLRRFAFVQILTKPYAGTLQANVP